MVEVLQRMALRYKTNLGLRSGFQVKFLPSSQRILVRGCLTLISISERVLIHQPRSQLVESVARSTMVIYLSVRTIVLVVVKVGTRLGIAVM